MAIWQFSFKVIPSEKALDASNTYPKQIDSDMIESIIRWDKRMLSDDSLGLISKNLKPTKSWSDNIKQFGALDETCVELFYEENVLASLSVRIDLRNITPHILESIINFIKANNGVIIAENGALLEPITEDVIKEIKRSDAYSFVKNPKGFLSSL